MGEPPQSLEHLITCEKHPSKGRTRRRCGRIGGQRMGSPEAERVKAQDRATDVFVIGGGPAGLAAAIAARQKGFSVTVADGAAPAIDKPCGEGLMPEAIAALEELGVSLGETARNRFRGIRFVENQLHVAADFPRGSGMGVRRTVLHELLIRRAEACGVELLWKMPVVAIGANGVHLTDGEVTARWIIGADGSASRVRKWSCLDGAAPETRRWATRRHYRIRPWSDYMEIHWGRRAQGYVTAVSPEEVSVVVIAETREGARFESAMNELPQLRERIADAEVLGRERGAVTETKTFRRVSRGNLALVGDASGGVDAITGEGMRLAFQQALALADAMEAGNLKSYEIRHRQMARRPLWMGRLMLQLGRNVWLRRRAMRALAETPGLFERMMAIHVGHATPREIVWAGAEMGWQFLAT